MFEKKSDEKTIPCMKYGPLYVNFKILMFFLLFDFGIFFDLNGYFSFTSTTLDTVNVQISGNLKQKLYITERGCFAI
jgi:hypothetical protein